MKKQFALLVICCSICFWCAITVIAHQRSQASHTPLKAVSVTLQKVATGEPGDSNRNPNTFESAVMHATTDEHGKFMFGYMRPGVYALGCSYEECCAAFSQTTGSRSERKTQQPSVNILINACEGMYCRVSSGKMTPDDWMTCSVTPAKTAISKGWSNSEEWLKAGGGVLLKIDGLRSIVSGKIEAE